MLLTHAKGKYCRRDSSHICYCIRHEQYLKYVLFIIIMYVFHIFNEQNLTCTGTYTKKKNPNLHARLPFFLNKMEKKNQTYKNNSIWRLHQSTAENARTRPCNLPKPRGPHVSAPSPASLHSCGSGWWASPASSTSMNRSS